VLTLALANSINDSVEGRALGSIRGAFIGAVMSGFGRI